MTESNVFTVLDEVRSPYLRMDEDNNEKPIVKKEVKIIDDFHY